MNKITILDTINSIFFLSSSLFVWLNVLKLIKDKAVMGVRLLPGVFFSISTIWGTYYYGQIGQTRSLVGITLLSMANTAWVVLAIYYVKIKK